MNAVIPSIVKKIWAITNALYKGYKGRMAALSVLGVVSGLLEGLGITFLIPLFVFFVGGSDASSNFAVRILQGVLDKLDLKVDFKIMLIATLFLFLLKAGVLFWFGYVRAKTVASYRMTIRKELYNNFLSADFLYLQKQKVGHLDTVLIREVKQSSKLFENIIGLILSFSTTISYSVVAFFLSPSITIMALIFGTGVLYLFKPLAIRMKTYSRALISSGKETSHMLAEVLYGIKTVKALGVEKAVYESALPSFRNIERLEFRKQIMKHLAKIALEPFSIFFILAVFAISYLYLKFNITTFVAIMYLIHQVFACFDKIQSGLHLISETIPSAVVVLETSREAKEHQIPDNGQKHFIFNKDLDFKNVGFGYSAAAAILNGISTKFLKGQAVGIIGPSGSGKTTLVDLILRLNVPSRGDIKMDGMLVGEINFGEWRRGVTYVPQEVFLMNSSIEENIRFFDSSITDEEIISAAKMANVYEMISALPKGFKTEAGERGTRFSGGERQRIALARALARKPSILILDEATSSLDAHAESVIKDTLKELKKQVTLIIIAHKPSTIDYVDRVIAIKGGKIIEEGDPADLLSKEKSYFREIYEKGSEL